MKAPRDRERLAWTIVLIGNAVFLALALGVPFGIHQWIQRATVVPEMVLQALEGTAQVEEPNSSSRLVLAGQEPIRIRPGAAILNDSDTETLLTISSPGGDHVLGTVQIYPNTQLAISLAKSPRYQSSNATHQIELAVTTGRIRLGIAHEPGRNSDIQCQTPHAQFRLLDPGSYSLDVSNEQSQITVREGQVSVHTESEELELSEQERGVVALDGLVRGPLPPERDLIINGSFRRELDGWQIHTDTADVNESPGEVEVVASSGQQTVRLFRAGANHAETGIVQTINQSLSDYGSLQLHLSARLDLQSLGVCGTLGSECPLMVRIKYRDVGGNEQQWVQGFFYWVDPNATYPTPTLCVMCPHPRQEHEQHSQGVQFFYDSPNLIELLALDGNPPTSIIEIAIYASGHSYDVQVGEVELSVNE